ncbi:MAG TPA: hypothetical protein VHM91_05855 [Verrucomicrobiales bacterium]|jgi:hypothetical protein|nr:hypothetical protein [Verrucomicrobiales bacterium]
MKRLALIALSLVFAGCDSDKNDADSTKTGSPSPVGSWEIRSNPGTPYFYTRYEFKDDHSFTRENGTSQGVVTRKISGSWTASSQEAPHYSIGTSLTDDMLRGAGAEPKAGRVPGSLVLRYNVKSKSAIEVGATLVGQRGPVMELEKQTFDLEEHLPLALNKAEGGEWLTIGKERYSRVPL